MRGNFMYRLPSLDRQIAEKAAKVSGLQLLISDMERQVLELDNLIDKEEGKFESFDPNSLTYPQLAREARTRQQNCEATLKSLRDNLKVARGELRILENRQSASARQRVRIQKKKRRKK